MSRVALCYDPLRFILIVANCATQKEIKKHDLRNRKNRKSCFFPLEPSGVPFFFLSCLCLCFFFSLLLGFVASLPRCLVASLPLGPWPLALGPRRPLALGPRALGLGPWALGLGPWALGLGPWALGLGPWALGLGPWALGLGPLAFGLWPLAFGLWPLAPWPLAFGLWPFLLFSFSFSPFSHVSTFTPFSMVLLLFSLLSLFPVVHVLLPVFSFLSLCFVILAFSHSFSRSGPQFLGPHFRIPRIPRILKMQGPEQARTHFFSDENLGQVPGGDNTNCSACHGMLSSVLSLERLHLSPWPLSYIQFSSYTKLWLDHLNSFSSHS